MKQISIPIKRRFSMKHLSRILIALVLALVIAGTLPAQVFADSVPEYISEVKIFEGSYSAASGEGYKILSDDKGNPVDLNQGAGATGIGAKGNKAVYLGYKTTTKRDEAITDLALMNMKGGYSVEEYDALMETQMKSQIIPLVERFMVAINEYRENLESPETANRQRAEYVKSILDKFIDDDTGRGLGTLLINETKYEMGVKAFNALSDKDKQKTNVIKESNKAFEKLSAEEKKNHADILTILAQSNGQITLAIENLITRAADTSGEPWLDRFTAITYDDLVEALDMLPTDADAELAMAFDSDAKKILEMWDAFRTELLNSEKGEKAAARFDEDKMNESIELLDSFDWETADDETIEETARSWAETEIDAKDLANKVSDFFLAEYLKETEYGEGTLYDFFTRTYEDISANPRELYPIIASLSEGQRAGLDYITLADLIMVAATDAGDYSDAELDKLETVSVYEGVNRELYKKGGVALTSDALRKDAKELVADRGMSATGIIGIVMAALAGSALVAFGATLAVKLSIVSRIAAAEKSIKIATESVTAYSECVRNFTDKGVKLVSKGIMKGSEYQTKFFAMQKDRETFRAEKSTEKKLLNEDIDRLKGRSTTCNALMIGLTVAFIILTAVSVYLSYKEMVDYYKVEFTPIPRYMVEEKDITAYNGHGDKIVLKNQPAYYTAVDCNRTSKDEYYGTLGTCADMNGGVGQQWLALYAQKSDVTAPIIADSLIAMVYKNVNSVSVPAGYTTGIHMFGSGAAFNLNNELYDWNKDAPCVMVFFRTDSGSSANTAASNFSTGSLAVAGGAGLVLGALISGFAVKAAGKKKKAAAA